MNQSFSVAVKFICVVWVLALQGCGNTLGLFKKTENNLQGQNRALMKSVATPLEQPNHFLINLRWAPFIFEQSNSEDRTWMIFKGKESQSLNPWLSVPQNQTDAKDSKIGRAHV